jgi:hypothetical protein
VRRHLGFNNGRGFYHLRRNKVSSPCLDEVTGPISGYYIEEPGQVSWAQDWTGFTILGRNSMHHDR